jgi:hypothetical protein
MTLSTQLPLLKCPRTIPGTPHPLSGVRKRFANRLRANSKGFQRG